MRGRLVVVTVVALALVGCATGERAGITPAPTSPPASAPTATSTAGAWDVDVRVINEFGAAGTATVTFTDGRTKVLTFTAADQDLIEKDRVLVGQTVSMDIDVTDPPKEDRQVVCTIASFKLSVASEGGSLASNIGSDKFRCTWTNDGTVVMPKPEE